MLNPAYKKIMENPRVERYIRFLTYVFALPGFVFGTILALFIVIFRWGVMVADMIDAYVLSEDWKKKGKRKWH